MHTLIDYVKKTELEQLDYSGNLLIDIDYLNLYLWIFNAFISKDQLWQKNGLYYRSKGETEVSCFNKRVHIVVILKMTYIYIMKLLYSPVLAYIMLGVMIFAELTPLRRSALAFACLKRGSSFVMVYWCIICSVFALYAS